MFRKIRNRILLLNMAMVSAVVVVAFAAIFGLTYYQVQSENNEKLLYGAVPQTLMSGGFYIHEEVMRAESETDGPVVSSVMRRISPGAGLSFSLLMDGDGNVIEINSLMDIPQDAYEQAAYQIAEPAEGGTTIMLEGRIWQYSKSPVAMEYLDSAGMVVAISEDLNNVRFLDVTDSHRMLSSLALILSGLTVVILTAFFFISRFFANRAIRPMAEAWDKQSRFVADASHELKTPLSIISTNCGALYANPGETVDSQQRWIDSIMRAADRMTGFVESLLSLARMEDAQLTLRVLPFDISAATANAVQEMTAPALAKEISITTRIEPGVLIESDQECVRQVLSNLLDNAVKYTDNGGEITVTLKKDKRYIACVVRNSGGGIPAEDLPRLFDRFYRGDPARSSENRGYGLGLSIAKAAAERLGAKLHADSRPGEYTEFALLLNSKA